jgi:hypothetical protein
LLGEVLFIAFENNIGHIGKNILVVNREPLICTLNFPDAFTKFLRPINEIKLNLH